MFLPAGQFYNISHPHPYNFTPSPSLTMDERIDQYQRTILASNYIKVRTKISLSQYPRILYPLLMHIGRYTGIAQWGGYVIRSEG